MVIAKSDFLPPHTHTGGAFVVSPRRNPGESFFSGVILAMNKASSSCDCSRWKVALPERRVNFTAACACAERCDCRRRSRVRASLALMAVFVALGALFGGIGARRENSRNLAALREVHLSDLGIGGGR